MSALALLRLTFDRRRVMIALAAAAGIALIIGVPTDVVPNPWFTRMSPVRLLDDVLLPLTSVLVGTLLATYVGADPASRAREANTGVLSGTLGFLAIGCPICNKLVVGLLGVSGALQYFGPVQPVLGVLAIGFALWALRVRLRAMTQGCPVPMAS